MKHLKKKLRLRDPAAYKKIRTVKVPEPHPSFMIIEGPVEEWERLI